MATFDDFKRGERVAHVAIGDGTVTKVDEFVHVTFDRKDGRRQPVTGKYDRRWFEINPTFLFHRRAA